jgi:hypothetical protein
MVQEHFVLATLVKASPWRAGLRADEIMVVLLLLISVMQQEMFKLLFRMKLLRDPFEQNGVL